MANSDYDATAFGDSYRVAHHDGNAGYNHLADIDVNHFCHVDADWNEYGNGDPNATGHRYGHGHTDSSIYANGYSNGAAIRQRNGHQHSDSRRYDCPHFSADRHRYAAADRRADRSADRNGDADSYCSTDGCAHEYGRSNGDTLRVQSDCNHSPPIP